MSFYITFDDLNHLVTYLSQNHYLVKETATYNKNGKKEHSRRRSLEKDIGHWLFGKTLNHKTTTLISSDLMICEKKKTRIQLPG